MAVSPEGTSAEFDVVVATHDRPELLAACIDSLERQTFMGFRLIVVDDAGRVPAAAPRATVLRNERSVGPGGSRNRGVAAGAAPYVLFLDDDVRAHPELLAAHRVALSGGGPVVSIGALLPPPGVRLPPWDLWQADRLAREQRRLAAGAAASWTHVYTGNVALRRADFEAAGGFDTSFARQEDVELGYRLSEAGCRFVFAPDALVWHDARHSLADWLRIPAASARYDVLIDRTRPGSGRLRSVRDAEHHPALRAARGLVRGPRSARAVERLAIAAAGALHRVRADRLAVPAYSLVWDIEYDRALAAALAAEG